PSFVILSSLCFLFSFFFHPSSPTSFYTLSLHDALPIFLRPFSFCIYTSYIFSFWGINKYLSYHFMADVYMPIVALYLIATCDNVLCIILEWKIFQVIYQQLCLSTVFRIYIFRRIELNNLCVF